MRRSVLCVGGGAPGHARSEAENKLPFQIGRLDLWRLKIGAPPPVATQPSRGGHGAAAPWAIHGPNADDARA